MSIVTPTVNATFIDVKQDEHHLSKTEWTQKGLLILTTACALISFIPPLRFGGALALRGTALLSSGVNVIDSWKKEGALGRLAQIAKVAIVALGIVGLAAGSPVLIVASLAADIALQTFEFARAIYHKEPIKALTCLCIIAIDSLVLSAMVVGSWQLMVAAALTHFVFMFIVGITVACNKFNPNGEMSHPSVIIDIICYASLATFGVFSMKSLFNTQSFYPKPLPPEKFPILPIGGPSIVTKDT